MACKESTSELSLSSSLPSFDSIWTDNKLIGTEFGFELDRRRMNVVAVSVVVGCEEMDEEKEDIMK